MEVFYFGVKGWGVRAVSSIEKGEFVAEYVGELIYSEEAEKRGRMYDASRCSTL
jgi:SET domain-containing protein